MATATQPLSQTPPTLSEAVCGLLNVLGAGDGEGRLSIASRSRHGFGQHHVAVIAERHNWIPAPVLGLLEDGVWSSRVALPVVTEGATPRPLRLGALVATVDVPRVYRNPADPDRAAGRRWIFDDVALGGAFRRFEALVVPTLVIDARMCLVGVWALAEPLDVRSAAARSAALELHRRLAQAVGAVEPPARARLEDLVIPMPGGVVRQSDYESSACVAFNRGVAYTVAEIEAALAARKE